MKNFTYEQYINSPWDFLLEEAKQEVNSDDETPESQESQENNDAGNEEQGEDGPLLSEEELQQLAQELQQSDNIDEEIKKLLDSGKINQQDIEILGQMLQGDEMSPEEEQAVQINNIQEMVIRFSIYDKLNDLETKLNVFTEHFPNIDEEFYKKVTQIHEYIKVINSLIFNLEINLVYQLFGNLEMSLIQIFKDYQNQKIGETK